MYDIDERMEPRDPFSSGIAKAIQAARASIDQRQQHDALRKSMLAAANTFNAQPRERGFANNLNNLMQGVGQGLQAYDVAEEQAQKENAAMAQIMADYELKERDRAFRERAQEESLADEAWRRDLAERKFKADMDQQNILNYFKELELEKKYPNYNRETDNKGLIPFADKKERNIYIKDYKALGSVLKEIDELEKSYNNYRESTDKNIFDPMLPIGRAIVGAEGKIGEYSGNKKFLKEKAKRDAFKSKINKFVANSERALKGGGVLGPQIIKMFKEQAIYPDFNDTPESFEGKLDGIRSEILNNYKVAEASLRYGAHVTLADLKEAENINKQTEEVSEMPSVDIEENNDDVPMVDIEGNPVWVHPDDVEAALAQGFIRG